MNKEKLESLQQEWEKLPETEAKLPKRLPLRNVVLAPEVFQCRDRFNPKNGVTKEGGAHVAGMVGHLKGSSTADLDPVTILRVGGRSILIDGHHRLAAYKTARRTDIPVQYFTKGGPATALLNCGAENQKTKLTMTALDRSQWAWELVKAKRYSKAEESRASGASERTIATMRSALKRMEADGEPVPEQWRGVIAKEYQDGDGKKAQEQAREWAAGLSQLVGPSKTFKTLGKKQMLAEALMLWSPRIAEELVMLMAEEFDLTAKVEEMHEFHVQELGEERLDQLINERAEAMLVAQGKIEAPAF